MKETFTSLKIEPLSPANWAAFEKLFGPRGACAGCWCMFYRLPNQEFVAGKKNDGNKKAMKKTVREGKPAGLIGFIDGQPVAWCALAPREDFIKMERSRVHKRIDDKPVWSIPCLFIDKHFRNRGLSVALLKAVIAYAKREKIGILEAYPVIPATGKLPDSFAWTGLYTAFERAGFRIVDRKSKNRPMVRWFNGTR